MSAPVRTFLFTDIEGSYRQWERHPEAMPRALSAHDAILQQAVIGNRGRIFKTVGDAVCAVFDTPLDGAQAAVDAQRALFAAPWAEIGLAQPLTVRMALQAGEADERDGDFTGLVLNRISRLLRAGHGGQVLVAPSVAGELPQGALPGVGLRDFGERRLRDVPGANRIYQLEIEGLPISFPPLVTLDTVAHNLPVALNPCLDRQAELAQIRALLLDTPARLVTLLGPGGIGKTRLALHAAMQLIDAFSGGVWFVDLSAVRDAGLAPAVVASVLGMHIVPDCDPIDAIAEQTGGRELLLMLDNCEQIVDGVAEWVALLLLRAPSVRVLATSRVPLQIRGEQRVDIGPLPVETDEHPGPAVELFLERARQIRPSFELTETNRESIFEICHRVDGIPLALELAAARVAVLSPDALRARLSSRLTLLTSSSRDLPERHQTLRAAIRWSYTLLTEEEQRVFRALSVFQGGWSFAAAQAVLDLDELATMDMLTSLRDKSLVRLAETDNGEARYSMLETIQEFGMEQLSAHEELDAVQSVHAGLFAELVAESAKYVEGGPHQRQWLLTLDREIANIRAVLRWSIDASNTDLALDLCINSWGYWSQRGMAGEGQRWFERALTLVAEAPASVQARVFRQMGHLCVERGELLTAESLYRAALAIERSEQNLEGIANSLVNLGMVSGMLGRMPDEHDIQQEALAAFRELDDNRGVAYSLFNLAYCARNHGKLDEAFLLLEAVGAIQVDLQDEIGMAFRHVLRAQLERDKDDLDAALIYLDAAARIFESEQVDGGMLHIWLARAAIELDRGNIPSAQTLIEQATDGFETLGDKAFLASALELWAAIDVRAGAAGRGAEWFGAAERLRMLTGAAIAPVDQSRVANTRASLEGMLGAQSFAIRREQGQLRMSRAASPETGLSTALELVLSTSTL